MLFGSSGSPVGNFKARVVQRLVGPRAASANALASEIGVSQESLSRWLRVARNVGGMTPRAKKSWTGADKLRVVRPEKGRNQRSRQEGLAWIAGRVGVFFGHAATATIRRDGSATQAFDEGPLPRYPELEAFAMAIAAEAARRGLECTCSAVTLDGVHLDAIERGAQP
ncbi:MAG: hypothetical protein ACT4P7_10085 [Gemmatimonadaceae bacterium]